MKHTKKLLSLLMTLVMALSLTTGFTSKTATAAQQLTVTLRVEQDATTLLAPVKIILTEADKKEFGIGLSTETLTPLHALAKYLQTEKKVSDEDMKNYISQSAGWITSIKINDTDNGTSSNMNQSETSWMFAVNNKSNIVNEEASEGSEYAINYSSYDYPLANNDSIVFYGVWYGIWGQLDAYYSAFDKEIYEATSKKDVTVSLKQCGIYDVDNTLNSCANATVIASQNGNPVPTKYDIKGTTDKNGTVNLHFPSAGTYTLSAYREISVENDNNTTTKHYDISRPYAVVIVTDEQVENPPAKQEQTITQQKENTSTTTTATVKKPAKVTKLKATVKKSKKTKKSVKLSWKKAANAKGYQIYVRKNKSNTKFTKKTTVKKNKATIKLVKGTYQIKVRAYNKSGSTTKKGSFSKILKVKVK